MGQPPAPAEHALPDRRRTATAWCLGAGYAVLCLLLALWLHPIEAHGPENDGYTLSVMQLLQGGPVYDGFHPTHPHLLGGAIAWCGIGPFTALRMVAAASGGAIVALSWLLAVRLWGTRHAWLAPAAVGCHPAILLHSWLASSDAMAVALLLACCHAVVRQITVPQRGGAFAAGLWFGLALGTRFSMLGFLPLLLFAARPPRRITVPVVGLGLLLGFLPHAIVSVLERGGAFVSDNWRNLALKLSDFDAAVLDAPGVHSGSELLLQRGGELSVLALRDLGRLCGGDAGSLLLGDVGPVLAISASVVLLGTVIAAAWRGGPQRPLAWGLLSFGALVVVTFRPIERILLPAFPLSVLLLGCWLGNARAAVRVAAFAALLAVLLADLRALPPRLREFLDLHPFAEIEAVRACHADPSILLPASTHSGMLLHTGAESARLASLPPRADTSAATALAHLQREQGRKGFDVAVIGRRTAEHLHTAARELSTTPACEVLRSDDDVVCVRLPLAVQRGVAAARWLGAAADVEWGPAPILRLDARLQPDVDPTRIRAAECVVRLADGSQHRLRMGASGERGFALELHLRPPPGAYRTFVRLRLDDGSWIEGADRIVTVR